MSDTVNPKPIVDRGIAAHKADAADPHAAAGYVDEADVDGLISAFAGTLGEAAFLDVGTTAGTVAAGDDSRLSNARTPTAHKSTHATGGTDALTPADIGAASSAHTQAISTITGLQTALDAKAPTNSPTFTGVVQVPSVRVGGTSAAFPGLFQSGTTLQVRTADNSADAQLSAGPITIVGGSLSLGDGASAIVSWGTRLRMRSTANGVGVLYAATGSNVRLVLGAGSTPASGDPSIKRVSGGFQVRNFDDSAFGDLEAGNCVANGPSRPGSYTVATLPLASAYAGYFVTTSDAGPCWSNGTNWFPLTLGSAL